MVFASAFDDAVYRFIMLSPLTVMLAIVGLIRLRKARARDEAETVKRELAYTGASAWNDDGTPAE